MIDFIKTNIKEIISVIVPLGIWLLNTWTQSPAKLVQGTKHAFTFLLQEPSLDNEGNVLSSTKMVNTASLMFTNTGKNTAKNIEITFNWKPHHINLSPPRHYEENSSPDKRWTIKFASLAPKEFIGIELLSVNADLPQITSARCDQCSAINVHLLPQEVHPRWKTRFVLWLLISGLAINVYGLSALIQLIANTANH